MTINELLALNGLTANDEIPVWDAEAAPNEPTKKITGSNLASSVKTLGSLLGTSDVVDDLTSTATDKPGSANMLKTLNEKIAVVNKNITLGQSLNPSQIKECVFDISDLKQTYSEVYLLNFAGVSGSNYGSFQFCFGYAASNNMYSVGIRNNSTSAQTASSFDVQFLCIK